MQAETKHDLDDDWLIGDGIALTMIDTVPPQGHIAEVVIAKRDDGDYDLTVGTAGIRQWHRDGASADRGHDARLQRRADSSAPVRYAERRPRHRRLWQRRHIRRWQSHP